MIGEDPTVERAWWVFHLPAGVVATVPAETEAEARAVLVRNCYPATKLYPAAPVHEWPCVGSRWTSRDRLVMLDAMTDGD